MVVPLYTLRGRVWWADGTNLTEARIEGFATHRSSSVQEPQLVEGGFHTLLTPGDYHVTITPPDGNHPNHTEYFHLEGDMELDIQIPELVTLRGVVVDLDGQPVPGLHLLAQRDWCPGQSIEILELLGGYRSCQQADYYSAYQPGAEVEDHLPG